MRNYVDLKRDLDQNNNQNLLILDSNNIQFYYQHEAILSKNAIFDAYDIILIPNWVYSEVIHHERKRNYIGSIPKPIYLIDECDDYIQMLDYNDKRLM